MSKLPSFDLPTAPLDAGTTLLVLMAALKLLETHTPRDHVIVVFIAWFLCIATFFYDQSLVSIAWVVPGAWLGAAALLFVLLGVMACALPAWRAARVDLMQALRHE